MLPEGEGHAFLESTPTQSTQGGPQPGGFALSLVSFSASGKY